MTGQRSTLAGNVPVGFWSTYFWHILGACWLFDVGATDEHDSRDEMVREKMPLRLAELTKGYPYKGKSGASDTAEDDLLPRPRFSTRQYDALFVRVETELLDSKTSKPKTHPIRLITAALKSDLDLKETKYKGVWEDIRKTAI